MVYSHQSVDVIEGAENASISATPARNGIRCRIGPNADRHSPNRVATTGSSRAKFEESVKRVYAESRKRGGPYKPIPRRRLARMIGCSPRVIQDIEERFQAKLIRVFADVDCTSSAHVS